MRQCLGGLGSSVDWSLQNLGGVFDCAMSPEHHTKLETVSSN